MAGPCGPTVGDSASGSKDRFQLIIFVSELRWPIFDLGPYRLAMIGQSWSARGTFLPTPATLSMNNKSSRVDTRVRFAAFGSPICPY